MAIITVDIILDAAARSLLYQNVGQDELEKRVMQPQLVYLAHKLRISAQASLEPIKYRGDMIQGLASRPEGHNEAVVTQSAAHDVMVRFGTTGPYQGFPVPVKEWAVEKLGLPPERAGAVAAGVMQEGTSKFFERYYGYPPGSRGFDYPAYIVERKELNRIQYTAGRIGELAVRYALGKATGKP